MKQIKAQNYLEALGRKPILACTVDSPNSISLSKSRLRRLLAGLILTKFYYSRFDLAIALIIKQAYSLTQSHNMAVLDIGCANGDFLHILSGNIKSKNIVGLDREQLPSLSPDFQKIIATVPPLPLLDSSFDLITCLGTTEHIADEQKLVSEIYRVLKPKGVYLCTMPVEIELAGLIRHVVKHFTYPDRQDSNFMFGYSFNELLGRCPRIMHETEHKYYNYKYLLNDLKKEFSSVNVYTCPRYFLRPFAPVLFALCTK